MSLADDPEPAMIEPELIRSGIRGSEPEINSDQMIAALESRRKLVISDPLRERIDLSHDEDIAWFHFTKDGKGLVIRSGDTVRMWDTDTWMILNTWRAEEFGSPETTVAVSPNHLITIRASSDSSSSVTIRQLIHGEISDIAVELPQKDRWRFQLDAGANCVAAISAGRLALLDVRSGELIDDRACEPGQRLCLSPDLRYVAWDNRHGQLWLTQDYVTLLDRETGNTVQIRDRQVAIRISYFTADSQRLVVRRGSALAVYRPSKHQIESVLGNSADVRPVFSPHALAVYGVSEQSAAALVWELDPL